MTLSPGRVLLGALTMSLVLGGLFAGMTFHRLTQLGQSGIASCFSSLQPVSAECATVAVYRFLFTPQWVAAQFSVYVSSALLITWLFCRRAPATATLHAFLIGLTGAVLLLSIVEPGRLSALSAFIGAGLGGLMASRWSRGASRR